MPDNLFSEAEINAQIKATDKSEVGISWDWARGLIDLSAPEAADAESPPQLMNEIATRFRDALANGAAAPRPVNRLIVRLPLTDHVDDVRVPKMTHEFPAAFSQSARAKVMAARLRAEEALGEKKHSILDFDDAEALLLELVLQVFMAFAEEACAVGIQMAMTAGDVERECLRFLKGYAAQAGLMDEWPAPIGDTEISDGLRRRIEVSDEWKTYRQLLQNLAEAQADRQPAANSMEPSPVKEINGEVDGERQPTDARMASPTPNSAAPAREPSTELSAEIVKSLQGATVSLNSIRSALAPTEWAALAAVLEAEAARIAKVDEAMESAIPLTPRNSDEMIELLIRFSTDPKGLGLTAEQFGGLESGSQWLEHYHAWERTRRSAIRAKGQGGRPPKDQTREIHAEWVRIGKPKRTAAICDRIARSFFASELKGIHRGSPEHRRVRERVRKAIERIERRSAT
jgi:hypothetical protein